jgi:hypothetical protein
MTTGRYIRRVEHLVRVVGLITCGTFITACGDKRDEKPRDASNPIEAMGQLAKAGSKLEAATEDAAKFQQDRRARGDTVAMTYTALQVFLPDAPGGYSKAEAPSGSSQTIGAFSMTEAEQEYVGKADAEGNAPRLRVKLADFGGTEGAYGMFALPMMMNMSQEDAHHRMTTIKLGPAYTWASEEYDKDSKNSKVTAVTRYRYMVTVEAENQRADETGMLRSLAEQIVRRFEGK